MTFPGFSAEFSLGPASQPYASRSPGLDGRSAAAIIPQAHRGFGGQLGSRFGTFGTEGCIPGCLCVTREGCPCCHDVPPEMISMKRRSL